MPRENERLFNKGVAYKRSVRHLQRPAGDFLGLGLF